MNQNATSMPRLVPDEVEQDRAAVLARRITEPLGKRQCRRTQQYETAVMDLTVHRNIGTHLSATL